MHFASGERMTDSDGLAPGIGGGGGDDGLGCDGDSMGKHMRAYMLPERAQECSSSWPTRAGLTTERGKIGGLVHSFSGPMFPLTSTAEVGQLERVKQPCMICRFGANSVEHFCFATPADSVTPAYQVCKNLRVLHSSKKHRRR